MTTRRCVLSMGGGLLALAAAPAPAGRRIDLPMTYDAGGRPVIELELNGRGPFRFVVDTAAQRSAVGAALAGRLGLPEDDGGARLVGATGAAQARLYRIERLSFGGFSASQVKAAQLLHAGPGDTDGVLGMDVFEGQRLVFDFQKARFQLGAQAGRHHWLRLRTSLVARTIATVPVDGGASATTGIVDTGAHGTVANGLARTAFGVAADDPRLAVSGQGGGVTGHAAPVARGVPIALVIAGRRIADMPVVFADLPVFEALGLADRPTILLGQDLLRKFPALAVDYGRRWVEVAR